MNILYISYWSVSDSLSESTVLPRLRVLNEFKEVTSLVFCSVERGSFHSESLQNLGEKIKYLPLKSRLRRVLLLNKVHDFIYFPFILIRAVKKRKISLIICRSSLAGALGIMASKLFKVPIIVESFEPHADYMIDSKVWKRNSLRSIIQRIFEWYIMKSADYLMPVSVNYANYLIEKKVNSNKILTCPCTVPIKQFEFSVKQRENMRASMSIKNSIVGIYVGKFGGIYYDDEAYRLFKASFDFFGKDFFLVVLTPNNVIDVLNKLKQSQMPVDRVFVTSVKHENVPNYLSISDFAFSMIKPAPSRKYCSPIKHGEYWANGLPFFLERGVGDDSEIVENEGGGVILNWSNLNTSFSEMRELINVGRSDLANTISSLARKYRDEKFINETYDTLLKDAFN